MTGSRFWTSASASIIDLDDNLDIGVPAIPNQMLYIYYPIEDMPELPDLEKLLTIARMGAQLVNSGYKLLSHCGMGHNRSALVAGLILRYLGMSGDEVVSLLRERRQGALYNKAFAEYVCCAEISPCNSSSAQASRVTNRGDPFPMTAG